MDLFVQRLIFKVTSLFYVTYYRKTVHRGNVEQGIVKVVPIRK
ncbi:unnamed protein product, partial [Heterotrigona itama]